MAHPVRFFSGHVCSGDPAASRWVQRRLRGRSGRSLCSSQEASGGEGGAFSLQGGASRVLGEWSRLQCRRCARADCCVVSSWDGASRMLGGEYKYRAPTRRAAAGAGESRSYRAPRNNRRLGVRVRRACCKIVGKVSVMGACFSSQRPALQDSTVGEGRATAKLLEFPPTPCRSSHLWTRVGMPLVKFGMDLPIARRSCPAWRSAAQGW